MNRKQNEMISFEQYEDNIYLYLIINSLVFSDGIGSYMRRCKFNELSKSVIFNSLCNYLTIEPDYSRFNIRNKNNLYFLIDYLVGDDNSPETIGMNERLEQLRCIVHQIKDNNAGFLLEQYIIREFGAFNFKSHFRKLSRNFLENIMSLEREYYQSINNDYSVFSLLKSSDETYLKNVKNFSMAKDFYRSINYFLVAFPDLFLNLKYFNRVLDVIKNGDYQMDQLGIDNIDIDFIDLSNVTKKMVNVFERKNRRIFYK